ncbi:MAG: peroxiredoxin family protein [Deltaproteobacteria bacterium]|nr:peroxiredoxin family protein [Deltaproteobacteria bacterium]MBI3078151.1 peroxiredoxin family protein [Deltaproteobacteria bacterium]
MTQYRDVLAKFGEADAVVLGISPDNPFAVKAFAEKVGIQTPMLSDGSHVVGRLYGVFNEQTHRNRRVTFVVDKQGVIQHIDVDSVAVSPTGALGACALLKRKS